MSDLVQLQPFDQHNQTLKANVHPTDWTNPTPRGRYNLVVIGAGTAGLVTAAGAAGLGAKVALIERELMGGDCLNVGCVPSKGIIAAARVAAAARKAGEFGVNFSDVKIDFGRVMERMRRLRAAISPHDSAARFRDLGIDVYLGDGRFVDRHTIEVVGQQVEFKKAVIATGARAAELPIPGLKETGYLTNESVFSLTELPRRLIVIGAGPIGCEMAQCFARFGSQVTLIEKSVHILAREETDAVAIVQDAMREDGVRLLLNANVVRLEPRGEEKAVFVEMEGKEHELVGDQILVGIGRAPNVEEMGLEKAGVEFDDRDGVHVNDRLQTTNSNIFAAGDVATKYKFTHSADFMARIVIQNALFMGRATASKLLIPWTTFTSPEIAHVGMYPAEAAKQNIELETYTQQFSGVDRSILEGETDGFVRVHVKKGTDKILGATVVGELAGNLIGELTLAMKNGIGLKGIGSTIHPYPTQAEAIRRLGDMYSRTRLTPTIKKLFGWWLAWRR